MAPVGNRNITNLSCSRKPDIMHIQRLSICVIVLILVIIRRHEELIAIKTEHNVELKPLRLMVCKQVHLIFAGRPKTTPKLIYIGKKLTEIDMRLRVVCISKTELFQLAKGIVDHSMNHRKYPSCPAEDR